ncbi:hypothetical protein NT6N_10210 [Oceaniferula spumae]|uniref:Ice-binding protein C-terminal domain-containing protein n=1 Tax=Oceaniferula spumae TaxID=2979115 RepID=A0AAT9FJ59_9BACT
MNTTLITVSLLASAIVTANSAVIFSMENLGPDVTFEHDSDGINAPSPLPAAGSQAVAGGTFSWGNLATDTTPNTAVFSGTSFTASDWGGDGTYTSAAIDVTGVASATISFAGSSVFAAGGELFNFFYQVDGGSVQNFGASTGDGSVVSGNQLVNFSGNTNLVVGFTYNHNGVTDGVSVTDLSVSAVPEPSTFGLLGLAGLASLLRRRR